MKDNLIQILLGEITVQFRPNDFENQQNNDNTTR